MNQANVKYRTLRPLPIIDKAQDLRAADKTVSHKAGAFGYFSILLVLLFTPALLIWSEIIPFRYRFHTLLCILAGFLTFCLIRRYSFYELGFRTDNFRHSLGWNLLFCVFGAAGLYLISRAGIVKPAHSDYFLWSYGLYIFLLGPVQEIVFRGILFAEMKRIRIFNRIWFLLLTTLSSCFLHIIYNHPPLLAITFASGLIWGLIFIRWPNIWTISLSHSLLGALAMFFRLI
jgi:membrane protease YdiL (CAAX protease family)